MASPHLTKGIGVSAQERGHFDHWAIIELNYWEPGFFAPLCQDPDTRADTPNRATTRILMAILTDQKPQTKLIQTESHVVPQKVIMAPLVLRGFPRNSLLRRRLTTMFKILSTSHNLHHLCNNWKQKRETVPPHAGVKQRLTREQTGALRESMQLRHYSRFLAPSTSLLVGLSLALCPATGTHKTALFSARLVVTESASTGQRPFLSDTSGLRTDKSCPAIGRTAEQAAEEKKGPEEGFALHRS